MVRDIGLDSKPPFWDGMVNKTKRAGATKGHGPAAAISLVKEY